MATQDSDPLSQALARVVELESALHASQQELQHFFYAASHDLQEPLRAITTYTQLLDRLYSHDPQASELTAFITSGAARMNSLLQSLVTYSRISLSPTRRTLKLNSAVQAALFKLAPIIKECGADVRCQSLPELPVHEIQFGQLFEQVLLNCFLYRRQPPVVEISAEDTDLDGEPALVIRIKDNGVGIEPQFLTQVIQPFKRLHGKEIPGNGLGLSICEKIVRAHNGKLSLESDGASGTTVNLILPL